MGIIVTDTLANRFAVNLQRALDREGISQAQLARDAKITKGALNRIMRGKLTPSLGTIEKLGAKAKMRPGEIFA